jgi:endonuclease/exonuclease/phosphatase (EEP) superfamily protein YafD
MTYYQRFQYLGAIMQKILMIFTLLLMTSQAYGKVDAPEDRSFIQNALQDLRDLFEIPGPQNIMQNFGEGSKEALDPQDIEILVWNMFKGKKPSWARDYNRLARAKDILLLQEMFLNKNMRKIFESHEGYSYQTATSFIDIKKNARTGVATASRVASIDTAPQPSRALEPAINTPKMTLFTSYPIKGTNKTLLVANIHAVNFVPMFSLISQLRDATAVIKKHKGPVIFGGDFNTWSKGKVTALQSIMKEAGLVEVSFFPDERKKVFKNIIDYVFVKDLEVLKSRTWGYLPGSDHTAMTLRVRLK